MAVVVGSVFCVALQFLAGCVFWGVTSGCTVGLQVALFGREAGTSGGTAFSRPQPHGAR